MNRQTKEIVETIVFLAVFVILVVAIGVTAGCVAQAGGEEETTNFDIEVFGAQGEKFKTLTICAKVGANYPYGIFPEQHLNLKKKEERNDIILRMYTGPCHSA